MSGRARPQPIREPTIRRPTDSASSPVQSQGYIAVFGAVTLVTLGVAVVLENRDLALAAAILGLYVLHLLSLRTLLAGQREQWTALRDLEDLFWDLRRLERTEERRAGDGEGDRVEHRRFALGTVAIIRGVLSPDEVGRVLSEQRRSPGRRFGELALELDLLDGEALERLLAAQREGVFSRSEIRAARERLEAYHDRRAPGAAAGS